MHELIIIILSLGVLFFWAFLVLLIIYMSSALFVWPPSMPTDSKTRQAMIELAKRHFPQDTKFNAVDLGSGYGHLISTFLKAYKNATITGFEILRPPYYFSKLLFHKNTKVKILRGDFLNQDFSQFNLIMTFYKDMTSDQRLGEKLKRECQPGTVIISNNFVIPNFEIKDKLTAKLAIGERTSYLYII